MRVSERSKYETTKNRVEKAKGSNASMLEQISSQKRINKLSDDPIGAGQAIRQKQRLKTLNQLQKNIDYSKGYLRATEGAVSGIMDYLIRAKELAIGMANSSYDSDSRDAAGKEIQQIMDAVISLGNTTYGNRYVFGGFRTNTPPINPDGTYSGDDGLIFLQTGENKFKQININARALFDQSEQERTQGHFPMLTCLDILAEGLSSNDIESVRLAMSELDHQMGKTSSFQATIGSIFNALENSLAQLETDLDLGIEALSKLQDVDIYKASSDFKRTESVLQGTLVASNKLLQPSLLNFMQ